MEKAVRDALPERLTSAFQGGPTLIPPFVPSSRRPQRQKREWQGRQGRHTQGSVRTTANGDGNHTTAVDSRVPSISSDRPQAMPKRQIHHDNNLLSFCRVASWTCPAITHEKQSTTSVYGRWLSGLACRGWERSCGRPSAIAWLADPGCVILVRLNSRNG